jgi:hypothetical protein
LKRTQLIGITVEVQHDREVNPATGQEEPIWRLVITERATGDVTYIAFAEPVLDFIVQSLSSSVLVAQEIPAAI